MNQPGADEQDARDMSRLASGHDSALNALMERHVGRLFQYLLRSLQNQEDAADLAQETFVRVYQNRGKFNASQKFTTWLFAIAANLVRDRYRWRARHPQTSIEGVNGDAERGLRDTLQSSEPSPDQNLQSLECSEAVRRAVAALPPELQQPLILAVYEELPQAQIAEILNCSVKAVETRIYRARQQLRAALGAQLAQRAGG